MQDIQDMQVTVKFGDDISEFMRKLMKQENIPKEIKERAIYTFIYVRDYIVDQVCFVSAKENVFKRFVKNTDYKVENCRVWIQPKGKYMLYIGEQKLEDNKIYIIQCKPNLEVCGFWQAYDPGLLPRKQVFERNK